MQSSRGVTVFDPGGAAVATPSDRTLATTNATAVSSPRRTGPRRLRAATAVGLPAPDHAMISLVSFGRQTSRPVPGERRICPRTGAVDARASRRADRTSVVELRVFAYGSERQFRCGRERIGR